jgi:beta-galactosidase
MSKLITMYIYTTLRRLLPIALLMLLLRVCPAAPAQNNDFVWLEGEAPAAVNIKPNISGWGHKEFLSGEQWLQVSVDADKVDKEVPAEGVHLTYDFNIKTAGSYEVWNRIGYEFVRSPFDWCIDNADWIRINPDDLTTDLMELQNWNEVAWIKMGAMQLTPGPHKLEIRLPRTKDDKGKTARILYASDALCLTAGPFSPNGKYRPNEDGRDAADVEAAQKVFRLPEPTSTAARSSVALNGQWEVCRCDEQLPGETAAPIKDFPAQPHWKAIAVPGDKMQRPELVMAHRLWYRTRVEVPSGAARRSFHLVFPQNNLNTTVYVNGVYCGFNKNPYAHFEIDVTKAVKPGVNEVWVGIKDAYYGYSANPKNPMKLRKMFNLPLDWSHNGFQDLAYPVWNAFQSGILVTPEFVAAGPVYTSDAYCRPSVAHKELAVDVTVTNPGSAAAMGEVLCEAVDPKTGTVEKALAAKSFTVAAGAEQIVTVADRWENPKLWWPDAPHMYTLRTTLKVDGKPVDMQETPFGFREWTIEGINFKLNGIVFHGYHDGVMGDTPESWLAFYRKNHEQMMRFWGTSFLGMSPDAALDWFDRSGVVVRRQGMLDGEAIGYNAIENDPDLKKLYNSEIKMDLMNNWRDQMVAQVKGERNHPSVMIWSIENEWLYINCINLYGGLMDRFEEAVLKTSDAVRAADPTRPTMSDGGAANKDQSMPVHGNHYVFADRGYGQYPGLAYEANPTGGGRGRWTWDQKRPRFLGEDYFANGINPFDYAYFGGEETFQGKAQSHHAASIIARMLTEGYRWAGYGAWDLYMSESDADGDYHNSYAPRAVFCRQWDWTFKSGQKVKRTFGIFNDTHDEAPLTFTWTLTVGGKKVGGAGEYHVGPGLNEKFDVTIPMPAVTERQEGQLTLTLAAGGKPVFKDVKAVSVVNPVVGGSWMVDGNSNHAKLVSTNHQSPSTFVFDPAGSVVAFLKGNGIPFTALTSLKMLPATGKVLIIGKDALDVAESASSRLAAYASAGRSVIVLEQRNPLKYQALPAEMEPATNEGRTAFGEDMDHPVMRGLKQKDFFTWGDDEVVYRNAYLKPTRGGKSLVQCDNRLQNTALAEIPAGNGLLLLSQLTIGEKLSTNAVAQQLLLNLIDYGARYKLTYRPVAAAAQEIPLLAKTLDAVSLTYSKVSDPLQAIALPGSRIAVIAATPANLKTLAANTAKVNQFTQSGGWILFDGLTPEGLADYNKLVGYEHMIRPFTRERVTFPPSKNPLTAGLTTGDIVMHSGERIFNWTSDEYVASDIFSYVVDYDEVATFGKFSSDFLHNIVNGFVGADGWPLIVDVPVTQNSIPFTLPRPEEITEFTWIGNTFYHPATKVELIFDPKAGGSGDVVPFAVEPNNQPQTFTLNPSHKGKEITLRIAEWKKVSTQDIVGCDNIYLKAKRPADFYKRVKPLLNIGAMMEYPQGKGGIVLCNLLFKENETVPENAVKKRTIFATLLRNLKAPFSGGKSIIAGANLKYTPIDISKQATQYRDERGWYGDKTFTFKDLPTGRQTFAGVTYQIYDFPTSPVPTAIMLAGQSVPNKLPDAVTGIPVHQKADALFFLQTARIDQRRNNDEIRDKKQYELARYVIHYADGQTANVPVTSEIDVDDYRQQAPAAIPGAQLAWVRSYPGTDFKAVAYAKQWNNPRPNVEITTIDMVQGTDRRGVPALLAITAAIANP